MWNHKALKCMGMGWVKCMGMGWVKKGISVVLHYTTKRFVKLCFGLKSKSNAKHLRKKKSKSINFFFILNSHEQIFDK